MDDPDQLPFVDPARPPWVLSPADAPVIPPSDKPPREAPAPEEPARDAGGPVSPPRSFQASAGIQGRQFADQCDTLLSHLGYELRGRRILSDVGVEIDQAAISPTGEVVWFEYKGSIQGHRPGLRRTDTLKKAIANGALLAAVSDASPYVVITSHLPEGGSGAAMLRAALDLGYLADVVCLYDPSSTARLKRW